MYLTMLARGRSFYVAFPKKYGPKTGVGGKCSSHIRMYHLRVQLSTQIRTYPHKQDCFFTSNKHTKPKHCPSPANVQGISPASFVDLYTGLTYVRKEIHVEKGTVDDLINLLVHKDGVIKAVRSHGEFQSRSLMYW